MSDTHNPSDTAPEPTDLEARLSKVVWMSQAGNEAALASLIAELTDAELTDLIEVVFDATRSGIWCAISEDRRASIGHEFPQVILDTLPDTRPEAREASLLDRLLGELDTADEVALPEQVASLKDQDLALVLASLPPNQRHQVWLASSEDKQAATLVWLEEGVRESLLARMDETAVLPLVPALERSELVGVVESVSDEVADAIMKSLPSDDRADMESRLAFPEDSAGRLMDTDWVAVRADVNLGVVARYLKRRGDMPTQTDGLMIVDRDGLYLGKLPVSRILTRDDATTVADAMDANMDWVTVNTPEEEVAQLFQRRELTSVAVVDDEHRLVGRITLDDVLDLIRAQAEAPMMHMAGLEEGEDLFAPIISSGFRRMFWLGINLGTAFLAAWVIGLFEATLEQVVALAVLMPIVASMGGIAGSQTLTLAIRGLALGQITESNTRWLATKEIAIAGMNGLVWAIVVAGIAWLWFGDPRISAVIGAAMLINQFAAAVAGISVPLILNRFGIDPALSGSVVLTTVTDVVGFMSFLGLATLVLL